jgi:ferritin-like metal-binding protein YciE
MKLHLHAIGSLLQQPAQATRVRVRRLPTWSSGTWPQHHHTSICATATERHREAAVMSRARRLVAVRCEQRPTDQTGIAMTTKTMNDLLMTTMQDVYYAERQILKALPKLAKASENEELKNALMHHREETEGQVERLQKAFDALGKRARGKTCEAINGLIEEGDEVVEEFEQGPVRDAGIIACAQAVEHYEMARYGTIAAWAKAVGAHDVARLMQDTLDEEKKADSTLNQLAQRGLNQQAVKRAA